MKKFVATTTSAVIAIVLVGVGPMSALAGTRPRPRAPPRPKSAPSWRPRPTTS